MSKTSLSFEETLQSMIAAAKAEGYTEYCPNNLPITCIRPYSKHLLEHPNALHPSYKFPISVKYTDNYDGDIKTVIDNHALIYVDKYVALTIYECCYYLWHLKNRTLLYPKCTDDYQLTEESFLKIIDYFNKS
jgi:hypothetical protein